MKIRRKQALGLNDPLRHPDHPRPVTRREFLGQGLVTGGVMLAGASAFSLFGHPRAAYAALAPDIAALKSSPCNIVPGAGKIPFICFDLAGGANIAGSNVLVGQQGGQLDFLSTAGYSKLGLPGNMTPNSSIGAGSFVDKQLGLAFHSDSAFLRGILERTAVTTRANINGTVIPALSQNDTGNNPHNPMYGIYSAGALGDLLALIGSENSDSGGNSLAPSYMMNATVRPTKVDQASDVTGLVDTGKLVGLLNQADATAVLESMERISKKKLDNTTMRTDVSADAVVKDLVQCGYVKAADLADRYGNAKQALDPGIDALIVGPTGIFTQAEYDGDAEIRKTAAVMKMVVNGYAGAGTIEMGGFDYHTGDRATGEARDFRAGRCMGACLEYAARRHMPLMLYVFSDGSLSSNGMIDNSAAGRGKGVWTGDNQSTAAAFFLVYNPKGPISAIKNQIGFYTGDGSVASTGSPGANAVNLLAEMVVLNYMALHGQEGGFQGMHWASGVSTGLGSSGTYASLIGMPQIVSGPVAPS
ncbi:MAG: general secretion pathway protein GspF [Gammaproteobacteria bacterium]|nr:general secretion pathway protein GspF [Gammaproteobacteria bacterium]